MTRLNLKLSIGHGLLSGPKCGANVLDVGAGSRTSDGLQLKNVRS